jgi:hypothetical protein
MMSGVGTSKRPESPLPHDFTLIINSNVVDVVTDETVPLLDVFRNALSLKATRFGCSSTAPASCWSTARRSIAAASSADKHCGPQNQP